MATEGSEFWLQEGSGSQLWEILRNGHRSVLGFGCGRVLIFGQRKVMDFSCGRFWISAVGVSVFQL